MNKKRVTYGVYGMMEYQAMIKVGRATLRVLFTDGSMTSMGQVPARYTTDNYIVQRSIEDSSEYKRGRIKTISTVALKDELVVEGRSMDEAVETASHDDSDTAVDIGVETPVHEGSGDVTAMAGGKGSSAPCEDSETAAESVMTEVEFDTNDEAKAYLEETFGVKRSTLANRAAIVSCGETFGVKIHFT